VKRLLLCVTCLSMLTAAAHASPRRTLVLNDPNSGRDLDVVTAAPASPGPLSVEDAPIRPVPEPGTMALAAMGLIALGAATRRRRAR
jgi:hypothetical protein